MPPTLLRADLDRIADEIATLGAHLDAATHRLLTCIRTFDEEGGWGCQGAMSCAHWLSWRIGLDLGAAREKVRVARALGKLPHLDDALRRGVVSYAKVRAMTRIATPETEAKLLDMALHATGAQLERIVRGVRHVRQENAGDAGAPEASARFVRAQPTTHGTVRLEAELLPDEAALVLLALENARHALRARAAPPRSDATATSREPLPGRDPAGLAQPTRADALVAVAESFLAHGEAAGTGGDRTQLFVHLARSALAPDGVLAGTLDDGTHVSAETFRRLACDSGLVPVALDETGAPLDVGRRTRSIPPAIRRALWLRDKGCRFPGCRNTLYVHGHHIQSWLHGGETKLQNLVLLCAAHHRSVHEDGWQIDRDASTDKLRFRAPEGPWLDRVPRRDEVDGRMIDHLTADLTIDAETNRCRWDGDRVDYGWAVEALV
jgi:hypothetical protein